MSGDGRAEEHAAEIGRLEEAADQVTRDTVLAIHRTFVTPFDRSQILDLITALDDTIDLMKETGRRMLRYGVGFTPKMQGMADCAVRAATEIRDAIPLLGAGMAKAGPAAAVWGGVGLIGSAIVLSPLTGFLLAMGLVLVTTWLASRSTPFAVDRRFRVLQFLSSSMLSLAHGGNDAQKTMGIITVLLYSQGLLTGDFQVPFWVVLSCQAAMALGTLCGGWRIVRTMGSRITRLTPMQGFCAEGGGALALFGATWLGIPVSTTHTITGSVVGVGAARRLSAVRWGVARGSVVAWGITLPASAAVAAVCYWLSVLAIG